MTSASKVRLVVGLLGTAGELAGAVAELGAQGLRPAQVTVVAQADAFAGALHAWWQSGEASLSWIVCRPVIGVVPWAVEAAAAPRRAVGSAGLDAASGGALDDARALLGLHHWALQRQARQLHLHLEQGGALLLVEPDTEAEERNACTALLRHASGGVQTHEIAGAQER